jgi:hypothetical protein
VIGPLTLGQVNRNRKKHQASEDLLEKGLPYGNTFAWVLENAKQLKKPKPYQHPKGAVIWVDLQWIRL